MENINEEQNNEEKELYHLIEYAKWELFHFNALKRTTKVIKKELILMDKDILKLWKEKSGYNLFKKQIFIYLSNINKFKNQKDKLNEEKLKLINFWKKIISEKKINLANIETLPKRDISYFFINAKDKKIDAYKNYEILSENLYQIFKNFINHKITIDGFYNKGKLVIPINYKDKINNNNLLEEKNENKNFIEIIYINKKNETEDKIYILENDINFCKKLETELINDNIDNLVNNIFSQINEQNNIKEFYYCGEDGNKKCYKVINKKQFLINQKHKKDQLIKSENIKLKQNKNILENKKNILFQSTNNPIIKEKEKDIEKLRIQLIEKIKNLQNLNKIINEKNNNLLKLKNNLDNAKNKFNEEKNIFYNEQKNNNIDKNINNNNFDDDINDQKMQMQIEELKNKCLMNEKEYENKQQELSKRQKTFSDKEKFLQSYKIKNNNIIKSKENEYNQKNKIINNDEEQFEQKRITFRNSTNAFSIKEDNLKYKEEELKEKENELNLKEQKLKEREQKINDESINNDKKENEIDEKINEINEKLIYMKNKDYLMNYKKEEDNIDNNDNNVENEDIDEKELAKIQKELEEQLDLEEKNKNKKTQPNMSKIRKINIPKQNSLINSFDTNDSTIYRKTMSPNNYKYKNNIHFNEQKENTARYTINNINIQNNNKFSNAKKSINNNFIRSKTISAKNVTNYSMNNSLNNNINRISLNPSVLQTQTKINKNLPSLGLENIKGPINLNSIIQCFAHIPELSEGILELGYNKFFKDRKDIKLSRNFAAIVNNIFFPMKFNNNSRKYSPELFYETFLDMYPQKNPNAYINTLKIVKFIMETFHDELNIKKNNNNDDDEDIYMDENIDNSNEKEVLVKFLTKLTENNNSLISKLFYGLIKIKCVCNNCGNSIYAFDYYSYLYFELLKIKKYMLNNKYGNKNSLFLSLNDCLDYYRRPLNISTSLKEINQLFLEKFNINEKNGIFFCSKCQSEKKGTIYKSIFSAHTILPIILERGNDDNYYIDELKFPDELNLENYVEFNKSIKKYYLCGVISNLGRNNTLGQFCAYCRMMPNGKWFCYKNERVDYCTSQDVHQKGVPYMLFYHKI